MTGGYQRKWEVRRGRGRTAGDEARDSYYELPTIHRPHWKWLVIFYFFLGGISGASYVVASVANLVGGKEGKKTARVGYYVSFAALLPCPVLLILDLGRPERFYNMLRIVKLRSPMSVGTWGLVLFSAFSTISVLIQAARDGIIRRPARLGRLLAGIPTGLIGAMGSIPAFFVSGYTGVLLAATAVPLWTKNHLLMGPLFLASAVSNATAAITLVLSLRRNTTERALANLERLDSIALIAELGLLSLARSRFSPTIDRPLREGHTGRLLRYGVLGTGILLPLAVHAHGAWRGKHLPRAMTTLASTLVLAGGFIFRYVIVIAGRRSADDPHATFEMTSGEKQRLGNVTVGQAQDHPFH